jgi:DNA-binding transcriptional MerR regulator
MNITAEFEATLTPDGRPAWRHVPSGHVLPVVAGGSDVPPATPPAPGTPPAPAAPPAPPAPAGGQPAPAAGGDAGTAATYSQADVDRQTGRARTEATKEAERKVAETLGVPIEKAKQIIADSQAAEAASKTEAQRLLDEATTKDAQAAQDRADAAREKFEAKLERRLAAAGVAKGIDDEAQAAAVMARAVYVTARDLPADADDQAITDEITKIRTEVPGLFDAQAPATAGGQPAPPSGATGGRPPAGGQQPATGLDAGKERAEAMKATAQTADPFARWAKPA